MRTPQYSKVKNMSYKNPLFLTEKLWNNAFAWEERVLKYRKSPILSIPKLIEGNIDDVKLWTDIVFEEMENGKLRSCTGIENFVQIWENIVVFDNHNHALYFWIDTMRKWIITKWFELIHIDEHSDLWDNENEFNLKQALQDPEYTWNFTNLTCNVGNYIIPAIESGLVGNMIRIENEYQIDAYMDYIPSANSILNLDLDIFATELDHIPEEKKISLIINLLRKVKYVTIATSPYFIEQWKAIQMLQKIIQKPE
jgi:hypothetical protein